ncbi:MAG TPA: DUF1997 domain-containing protein [Oculatellaceae cyanobacterium]|jgi:hypothetical protein
MQSQFVENQPFEVPEDIFDSGANFIEPDAEVGEVASSIEPMRFSSQFVDCMEMYADAVTVAKYLDAHQGWFCRCAHPMTAEPLGDNGYALTIGRFGSFGYQVEPKIGLHLLPQEQGVYPIRTIPVPGYVAPGYEVDFNAAMHLVEVPNDRFNKKANLPAVITRVEWELDLSVYIQFPKFIYKLPKSVLQTTGDRVLREIVRQVSRRLTPKVQEDFHASLGIPFSPKSKKNRS